MNLLIGGSKEISNGVRIILFNTILILIFSLIYWIISQFDNNAFNGLNGNENFINFIYFTSTSLSANVFHSIKPISNLARGIVSLQQVIVLYEIVAFFTNLPLFSFKPFIKYFN